MYEGVCPQEENLDVIPVTYCGCPGNDGVENVCAPDLLTNPCHIEVEEIAGNFIKDNIYIVMENISPSHLIYYWN